MEHDSIRGQLTIRGLITGILGLIVITASSVYVALRMGALPWPTVFVTVVSLAVLGRLKQSTLMEINTTHTLMSAGAMVAGGLAFTIPGIWMLNPEANVPVYQLLVLAITGAILGTLFTMLARPRFIEREALPYPMGQAAYQTLIAGTKGGSSAIWLFSCLAISAVFTLLRDGFSLIPAALILYGGGLAFQPIAIWISPMAAGIGAIIGPALSLFWLGGAIFGYLLLIPFGLDAGIFADMAAADVFRQNLGIGLMVGTGLGILAKVLWERSRTFIKHIRHTEQPKQSALMLSGKNRWYFALTLVAAVLLLTIGTEITLLQAIITVIGIYLATNLAATLTGQTGINPMEILGILVLLAIQAVWMPTTIAAFSIAAVVAISCGLTGDMMNDLKSGHMVGTNPKAQFIAEGIGGIVGAVVAVIALLVLKQAYGTFGTEQLPAPQAAAVSSMVQGIGHIGAFVAGVVIGALLYLAKFPAATLGLGVYLPFSISAIMGFGALVLMAVRKIGGPKAAKAISDKTPLVASGFLGGEGITGVLLAIIAMF